MRPERPMPTRTRLATFVVVVAATAIGFVTPAGAVSDGSAPPTDQPTSRLQVA